MMIVRCPETPKGWLKNGKRLLSG